MGSTFLLSLIYISFITLGLPDSLLGSSWPVMHIDIGSGFSLLGTISLVGAMGTIISTVTYAKLNRYLKPGPLTAFCTFITGISMLSIGYVKSIWMMYLFTFLMGIGAGAVDASLNVYVVLNYRPKHLNYLSAFWSIGTIFGPSLLSWLFRNGRSWREAYITLAIVQLMLAVLQTASLGRWKKEGVVAPETVKKETRSIKKLVSRKSVRLAMLSILTYCATESVIFVWTASYCTSVRMFTESDAALIVSMIYWGFMLGNIIAGFQDGRLSDDTLILIGVLVMLLASVFFAFAPTPALMMVSTFMLGLGGGPIITAIYHQAPLHFGAEDADSVMGLISASSYFGSGVTPVLFGLIMKALDASLLPLLMLTGCILQLIVLRAKKKAYSKD